MVEAERIRKRRRLLGTQRDHLTLCLTVPHQHLSPPRAFGHLGAMRNRQRSLAARSSSCQHVTTGRPPHTVYGALGLESCDVVEIYVITRIPASVCCTCNDQTDVLHHNTQTQSTHTLTQAHTHSLSLTHTHEKRTVVSWKACARTHTRTRARAPSLSPTPQAHGGVLGG